MSVGALRTCWNKYSSMNVKTLCFGCKRRTYSWYVPEHAEKHYDYSTFPKFNEDGDIEVFCKGGVECMHEECGAIYNECRHPCEYCFTKRFDVIFLDPYPDLACKSRVTFTTKMPIETLTDEYKKLQLQ